MLRRSALLFCAMLLAAALASTLAPRHRLNAAEGAPDLEKMVPTQVGNWMLDTRARATLVNPEESELSRQLYQQVLARTYVNPNTRAAIMLSIAYGENQTRSRDLHVPDVCYPAGGFRIESVADGRLSLTGASLPVRRMVTQRMDRREPLTYWVVVGRHATTGAVPAKLVALSYGLRGIVADGMVIRVSSVGIPDEEAFRLQEEFVRSLLQAVRPPERDRLAGTV